MLQEYLKMLLNSNKTSVCAFGSALPAAAYAAQSAGTSQHLPIMPLTVPKSTEPWVGVELSPRFCSTSEPWQKTLTNSPRWKTPTSCRCCRSSSVVAALIARWRRRRKQRRIEITDMVRKLARRGLAGVGGRSRDKSKAIERINMEDKKNERGCQKVEK